MEVPGQAEAMSTRAQPPVECAGDARGWTDLSCVQPMISEVKTCAVCGAAFERPPKRSQARWDNQQTCNESCKGKLAQSTYWKRKTPPKPKPPPKPRRKRMSLQERRRRDNEIRARKRSERKQWLDRIKQRTPCMDCGGSFPPECMDFDHRDPSSKRMPVSKAVEKSWKTLLEEIEKCDLVCANCHRVRTRKQHEQGDIPNQHAPPSQDEHQMSLWDA